MQLFVDITCKQFVCALSAMNSHICPPAYFAFNFTVLVTVYVVDDMFTDIGILTLTLFLVTPYIYGYTAILSVSYIQPYIYIYTYTCIYIYTYMYTHYQSGYNNLGSNLLRLPQKPYKCM